MLLHINKKGMFYIASLLGLAIVVFLVVYANSAIFSRKKSAPMNAGQEPAKEKTEFSKKYLSGVKRFSNEQEFYDYLEQGEMMGSGTGQVFFGNSLGAGLPAATSLPTGGWLEASSDMNAAKSVSNQPERYSQTNVQVEGIDEPDIVKTDGQNIYYSREQYWRNNLIDRASGTSWEEKTLVPAPINEVDLIRSFPPTDLKKISNIDKKGELLLEGNTLAVIAADGVFVYDVSDPANPKEAWNLKLNNSNTSILTARLFGDEIYLVTQSRINRYQTCPLKPFSIGEEKMTIDCSEIYHPESVVPIDSTFQISDISFKNGQLQNSVSFAGSSSDSVVYMSPKNIYVTYTSPGDFAGIILDFFNLNKGLLPDELVDRIKKVGGYDISFSSKSNEINQIIDTYLGGLNNDDRLKLENDLANKMGDYLKLRQRDLETTGIVRVNVSDLKVDLNGTVPGHPLNQFSLDEYQGNLRIATTVGGNFWWSRFGGRVDSANDVYILDLDMSIKSSIKDLGLGERIYSVRFIGGKGFVVTFRQTDPFYVLNLADSKNPSVSGELKITGYSAYLHPIEDDLILGIGMEDQKVKVSLFDVSDPASPKEVDKYSLGEYWTDVSNNHHAFLLDKEHKIFFLPGGQGGYIFSYDGAKLKLAKAVSDISAKRAVYINDYLYILGDDKITALNEADWEQVNNLSL
jgi:inhibitor of cysteine peptidase